MVLSVKSAIEKFNDVNNNIIVGQDTFQFCFFSKMWGDSNNFVSTNPFHNIVFSFIENNTMKLLVHVSLWKWFEKHPHQCAHGKENEGYSENSYM